MIIKTNTMECRNCCFPQVSIFLLTVSKRELEGSISLDDNRTNHCRINLSVCL